MSRDDPVSFGARPVAVPTVLQMEAVECGAACLAMVLAHHRKWVSLDEARTECNVGRDGASAAEIVVAARRYGMSARGVRAEVADLADFGMPLIIYWEFKHFMVLEGGTRRGAVVNDPAVGRRVIPWEQFDLSFTGIALELHPGPEFVRSGERPSLVREAAAVTGGYRRQIALALAAGLLGVIAVIAVPSLCRAYVDHAFVVGGDPRLSPGVTSFFLFAAILVYAAATMVRNNVALTAAQRLAFSMNSQMLTRMLRLPIAYFQQRHSGVLAVRLKANDSLAVAFTITACAVVVDAVMLVAAMSVSVAIAPFVGLTEITIIAAAGIGLGAVNRVAVLDYSRYSSAMLRTSAVAAGALFSMRTIKANGQEAEAFERWSGALTRSANLSWPVRRRQLAYRAFPPSLAGVLICAVSILGGRQLQAGRVTPGCLLQLELLALIGVHGISRVVTSWEDLSSLSEDLAVRRDVMTYPIGTRVDPQTEEPAQGDVAVSADAAATPAGPSAASRIVQLSGHVEVKDVSFGFGKQHLLLEDVSFVVRPGHRVAIVGPSGSGKSTLAKVLAGLYIPTEGELLYDGVSRADLAPAMLAGSVGYVDQFTVFVQGTVRENLSLWDPTFTDVTLAEAARDAVIYREIVGRAGGFDRPMYDGASEWSGGQRQRLELARALATDPAVLVLDEATSQLDTLVEQQIYANLQRRGCTVIVVAHRLSSIRDSDAILVLADGRVVESGTHDSLVAAGGVYRGLIDDEE